MSSSSSENLGTAKNLNDGYSHEEEYEFFSSEFYYNKRLIDYTINDSEGKIKIQHTFQIRYRDLGPPPTKIRDKR